MVLTPRTLLVVLAGSLSLAGFKLDPGVHPVFTAAPAGITAGNEATVTVTVDQAGSTDTEIAISTDDPDDLTVPTEVDLPAGQTQVQFTVSSPSDAPGGAGKITATANGEYANSRLIMTSPID
jgi:hypothetical protein